MKEKTKKARNYTITYNPVELYTAEIQSYLEEAYNEVDKKIPNLKFLESLVAKYPHVPQFKSYVINVHFKFGNNNKAYQVTNELLASFPDYIFARLNKASEYLNKKEFDKVPLVLGPELNIAALYPERTTFHVSEVKPFLGIVFNYYLFTDNLDAATDTLNELIETVPDDPMLETYTLQLMAKRLDKNMGLLSADDSKARKVEYIAPEIQKTKEKPAFTHPEIEYLYTYGMRIDHQIIRNILELPKETLIADLERVISDSISRFDEYSTGEDYHEPSSCFASHAIYLLTELKSYESLPVILNILRQGEGYFDFWFGDSFEECLWECVYHLGGSKPDVLLAFMKEPNRYTYARSLVSKTVLQITFYQPNRRNEVIDWYREIFTFFLEQIDNEDIVDSQLLGLMVGDVLDFRGKELMDQVEALFNANVIPEGMNGTLDDVRKEMKEPSRDYFKLPMFDIFGRYNNINTWYYYKEEKDLYPETEDFDEEEYEDAEYADEDYPHYSLPETYKREEAKIGRNDPCPCGSGKKYKKCCLKE